MEKSDSTPEPLTNGGSSDPASLTPEAAKEKLAALEAAKLSRRQAFARIGFRAAATVVATLTADDLLRAVSREMERRAGNDKVARKVAQEFHDAGVAFADDPDPSGPGTPCTETKEETNCDGASAGPCCKAANSHQSYCRDCCLQYFGNGNVHPPNAPCYGSAFAYEICCGYC